MGCRSFSKLVVHYPLMTASQIQLLLQLSDLELKLLQIEASKKKLDKNYQSAVSTGKSSENKLQNFSKETIALAQKVQEGRERLEREKGILTSKYDQLKKSLKKHAQAIERDIHIQKKHVAEAEKALQLVEDQFKALKQREAESKQSAESASSEIKEVAKDSREELAALNARAEEIQAEKKSLIADIPIPALKEFQKVFQRYPMDPITPIDENRRCGSCALDVGPQSYLKLTTTQEIVRCAGCGRILRLGAA